MGQRRLRDVQPFGGVGKTPRLGKRQKIAEVPEFDEARKLRSITHRLHPNNMRPSAGGRGRLLRMKRASSHQRAWSVSLLQSGITLRRSDCQCFQAPMRSRSSMILVRRSKSLRRRSLISLQRRSSARHWRDIERRAFNGGQCLAALAVGFARRNDIFCVAPGKRSETRGPLAWRLGMSLLKYDLGPGSA